MIARWSISILIFVLTLFGIASQQQNPVPNQEIVLQFAGEIVTSDEVDHAILIVKRQLLGIGADNIKVHEQEDGRLSITYFSKTDVANVKKALSKDKETSFGYALSDRHQKRSRLPKDENPSPYNLDVYEIQSGQDTGGNLVGKNALDQKSEQYRFFNPNLLTVLYEIYANGLYQEKREDYKFRKDIALAINNTSYIIPEVRAGPIA